MPDENLTADEIKESQIATVKIMEFLGDLKKDLKAKSLQDNLPMLGNLAALVTFIGSVIGVIVGILWTVPMRWYTVVGVWTIIPVVFFWIPSKISKSKNQDYAILGILSLLGLMILTSTVISIGPPQVPQGTLIFTLSLVPLTTSCLIWGLRIVLFVSGMMTVIHKIILLSQMFAERNTQNLKMMATMAVSIGDLTTLASVAIESRKRST